MSVPAARLPPAAPPGPAATATTLLRRHRAAARRRSVLVSAVLAVLAVGLVVGSVFSGSLETSPAAALAALAGAGDPTTVYAVLSLRLPRSVVGLLVGIAFGLSGALFQSLARNPLASPDIIGISTGASFAAVVVLVTVGPFSVALTAGALVGAVLTALLILFLSIGQGLSPIRLVLIGIGIQAVLGALIDYLLSRAREDTLAQATLWLAGSLNARGWGHAAVIAVALVVLVPAVAALARPLRGLTLGEEVAGGMGVSVARCRTAVVLVGCALAAAAVAAAGPVALVAFLGPPIARGLVGSPGPALVPSALTAAVLLLAADRIAASGLGGAPVPAGLVTGALGAPYLLWTLRRRAAIRDA